MIKILSLFTGIGAFEKALENLNIDFEVLNFSEIDKYAVKSYCAIHHIEEKRNLGDITKINFSELPKNIDLITYGSPCQDFSSAGRQLGGERGSGTRSSLIWHAVDIVEKVKPKWIIWENVKNILSKKHVHNFNDYIKIMEELGYNNYYQIMNAKDYGVPQNRERVFTVSIKKSIDNQCFRFPEKQELTLRLKDLLETEVDKKYYMDKKIMLREEKINKSNNQISILGNTNPSKKGLGGNVYDCRNIAPTLTRNKGEGIKIIGELDMKGLRSIKSIYSKEGVAPTITTMQGGNTQPKILEKPVIISSRGRKSTSTKKNYEQKIEINKKGTTNCISTVQKDNYVLQQDYKVRKLTPKECWRLMCFTDKDIETCIDINISNSQLYKLAGNSICVKVLEAIFRELLKGGEKMYLLEEIEEMLTKHLKNLAILKELNFKLNEAKELLNNYNEEEKENIQGLQLGNCITEIRSGKTNIINRPTEQAVLKLEENRTMELHKIEQDMKDYKLKIRTKEKEIKRMENLLAGLNDIQKFVIEQFYMYCNKRWDYVIDVFVEKYKDVRSKEQLKRVKRNGLENMLEILNYGL